MILAASCEAFRSEAEAHLPFVQLPIIPSLSLPLHIAAYLDEHGSGSETAQGQVLLAELVTEAVCFEIARRGVESGVFLAPIGAEADAIRREQVNLQNKYAHKIHESFVDSTYRRVEGQLVARKGRPSRDTLLANAVVSSM